MEPSYDSFLRLCNTGLGALAGALIGLPGASLAPSPLSGGLLVVATTALGGAVGRRRGASRPFLYFALIVVIVLAGVVSNAMFG
jgi:hypothetical protein